MNDVRTVIVDGCRTPWDVAVGQMDDELREKIQAEEPESDQAFVDAYAEAHQRKFGEPFSIG